MKYAVVIFVLFVVSNCDVSTLSNADATDLAKIKVNILIQDGSKEKELDFVKVKLTDGKKQIINENISILLNDLPMDLYVKNDLYYTKKSFYKTDSLLRKEAYYFEIILPDSTRHALAHIKPTSSEDEAKFTMPKEVFPNEDFVLKWKQLKTPHELKIIKGVEVKEKSAENITEYGYEGRRIDTLNKRNGTYVIPKAYFMDSLTITRYLNVELSRKENGLIHSNLIKNSAINYHHLTEQTIPFKEF